MKVISIEECSYTKKIDCPLSKTKDCLKDTDVRKDAEKWSNWSVDHCENRRTSLSNKAINILKKIKGGKRLFFCGNSYIGEWEEIDLEIYWELIKKGYVEKIDKKIHSISCGHLTYRVTKRLY